jgi:uncharacterized protein with PQ loop repeat
MVHPHRQCGEEGSSTSGGWRNLAWPLKPSQTFTNAQLRAFCRAVSVQVHQGWDRETEKQLLSQGHQTGHFNNGTLVTLNNVYILLYSPHMYILYSILLYSSQCHSDISQSNIYIFLNYIILLLDLCIVRYYCTVGARNTSISLHPQ